MRLAEDMTSWKSSGIIARDFRHSHNGPEISKAPKKKNTKKWCKGKIGVKHELAIRVRAGEVYSLYPRNRMPCFILNEGGWRPDWCDEEEYCVKCGKILEAFLPRSRCTKPYLKKRRSE
jgi:hypothetical protein